ncbi:MAG: hypothetical protein ISS15_05470 [Alphaproteobacteria bacterium]|nr:hypothetical protein [Alphaproteobacteria bacterium]MBL6939430.1 hypothetical protein [Alphaproteobacteria bacterium]MBL7097089.1 hypothetical protein [Alphaproteobacteria bacterium]
MKRRHDLKRNPARRLLLVFGAAAAQIDQPVARQMFAREAEQIPKTNWETHGRQRKGDLARAGRALLREALEATAERRVAIARELIGLREALQSDFRPEPQPRRRGNKGHVYAAL